MNKKEDIINSVKSLDCKSARTHDDGFIYRRNVGRSVDDKSTVLWYKRIFCKHEYTNSCRHFYYPDISYSYCCKCDQWLRDKTPGSTTRLLKHMAGVK